MVLVPILVQIVGTTLLQLKITKTTLTIFLHIFQNIISSHSNPLQLFLHTSIVFFLWPYSNSNIIHIFNQYLPTLFIITHFIIIPYLFFIICSLFVAITTPASAFYSLLGTHGESSSLIFFSKEIPSLKRNLSLFTFC